MAFCDLHCHSTYSDGTDTPEALVQRASEMGLRALALTDHNTVAGLAPFLKAAEGSGVPPVCGCEFTTVMEDRELHIVGLFLPEDKWPEITASLEERNRAKIESNRECADALERAGYRISYGKLCERFPGVVHNRAHIGQLLMEEGHVSSLKEAFSTLLRPGSGFYREAPRPYAPKVVRNIVRWGGVAVWAHPPLSAEYDRIERFLPPLKDAGLDAVETRYSTYSMEDIAFMERMAKEHGLLPSGGSDYHGTRKPGIALGCANVPEGYWQALRELARARQ